MDYIADCQYSVIIFDEGGKEGFRIFGSWWQP